MIPFLISCAFGLNPDFCEGPLQFPEPIKDAKLIQVQVLIRHGARTPGANYFPEIATGEWFCDDPKAKAPRYHPAPVLHPRNYHEKFDERLMYWKPSCRKRDLTLKGMEQHIELGAAYRNHYTKEVSFLDEHISPETVYVRATEKDRTMKSAISFIQGMYPPKSPNEVLNIITDTDAAGVLHPEESWCPELKGIEDYFWEQPETKKTFEEFIAKYHDMFYKNLGINITAKDADKYTSFFLLLLCSNQTTPSWLTPEVADDFSQLSGFTNYAQNNNDKYRAVGASPLFREMFRIADDAISMQNAKKFVLLSSHDGALLAFLSTFKYTEKYSPPVRSHISIEFWDRDDQVFARIMMNGKPIKIDIVNNDPQKDGGLFLYSNLKSKMAQLGYLNHCFTKKIL